MTTIFYSVSHTHTQTQIKCIIKNEKSLHYITHIAFPRITLLLPVSMRVLLLLLQNIIKFSFSPLSIFFLLYHPHIFATIIISSQNNNNHKVDSYLLCERRTKRVHFLRENEGKSHQKTFLFDLNCELASRNHL